MVLKILILGKRSLKNTVCSHFPVSILRFFNHIYYIKHFKDYNTKLDHAELLPLSIFRSVTTTDFLPVWERSANSACHL